MLELTYRQNSNVEKVSPPPSFENQSLHEPTAQDRTVPVKGDLWQVDVERRLAFPVYWTGSPCRIIRGTWFLDLGNNSQLQPLSEDLAAQIEQAFKQTPWKGREPDDPFKLSLLDDAHFVLFFADETILFYENSFSSRLLMLVVSVEGLGCSKNRMHRTRRRPLASRSSAQVASSSRSRRSSRDLKSPASTKCRTSSSLFTASASAWTAPTSTAMSSNSRARSAALHGPTPRRRTPRAAWSFCPFSGAATLTYADEVEFEKDMNRLCLALLRRRAIHRVCDDQRDHAQGPRVGAQRPKHDSGRCFALHVCLIIIIKNIFYSHLVYVLGRTPQHRNKILAKVSTEINRIYSKFSKF